MPFFRRKVLLLRVYFEVRCFGLTFGDLAGRDAGGGTVEQRPALLLDHGCS